MLALLPCAATLGLHLALIARGRTYHEWRKLRRARARVAPTRSLFDYGVLNNFGLTLGVYPMLWLLPTRSGLEGNGIFYPEQERNH